MHEVVEKVAGVVFFIFVIVSLVAYAINDDRK